ncbi:unnamed protein product, partial [Rotaria sordida]
LRKQSMKCKQQDTDFIDKKFNLTILDALDENEVDDNLINIDRASSGSNHIDQLNYSDRYHPYMYKSLQLPILLLGDYDYDDYHCQVYLTNWRGIARGTLFVWLPSVLLTMVIYAYTMRYIRCHVSKFTLLQKKRIDRDFTVIRRILWLIIFIVLFGIPACSTTIVYYIFDYVGWRANHLTWLTFILSFNGMSIEQYYP